MRWLLSFLLLFAVLPTLAADSVSNPPVERDDGWQVGTLAAAGFDLEQMRKIDRLLENNSFKNVHMVVVEYNGKLVYEKYLSGSDENWGTPLGKRQFDYDSLHDLRSISKSVTALLLGIALGEDYQAAVKRPVIEYFPEYAEHFAPGAEKITLEHILTMTDGWEWNEMQVPYSNSENDEIQLYKSSDPIKYVLSRPMRSEPGDAWYYNGGTTMVLGALVEKISGKPFLDFAREALAAPLGVPEKYAEWRGLGIWSSWSTLPGVPSGLRLRARDLAKVGHLMLHRGKWQGKQVVPAGWVRASMRRHTEQTQDDWSRDGIYGYGYQWWHGQFRGTWGEFTAIAGVGYGSQRLFIIPEKKLVVTAFAGNYGTAAWGVNTLLMSRIVAAAP